MFQKNFTCLLLMFCFHQMVHAQTSTSLKAEVGYANSIYQITDPRRELRIDRALTPIYLLSVRQELSENLFLELGAARRRYDLHWNFRYNSGYSLETFLDTWMVPLRLGTRISLAKDRAHLVPTIGYVFGIDKMNQYGKSSGSGRSSGYTNGIDSISYTYDQNRLRKNYGMVQASMGFELRLTPRFHFVSNLGYYRGFSAVTEKIISYKVDNRPVQQASITSKGDMYSFTMGLVFEVGDFFKK